MAHGGKVTTKKTLTDTEIRNEKRKKENMMRQ